MTDLIHLQSLHSALHQTASTVRNIVEDLHEKSFNDSDDEDEEADPSGGDQILEGRDPELDLPPKCILLHLPSSHNTTAHPFHKAELVLQVKQATRYLAALHDAIAQKSFQYSHVHNAFGTFKRCLDLITHGHHPHN